MTRPTLAMLGVLLGVATPTAAQQAAATPDNPFRPAKKLTDLEARLLSASNGLTDTKRNLK